MDASRFLIVIADDFGIGPETTRGILDLAVRGVVTGTVLLSNSIHAEHAVGEWRRRAPDLDMGWHPCLTMDPPAAGACRVPSLVGPDGCLWPLRRFLPRLLTGLIRSEHIAIELKAQYSRFCDLTGGPPVLVNSHQHVALFPPVGRILRRVLARIRPLPYVRRIRERWRLLHRIPGARLKRTVLSCLGLLDNLSQDRQGFPGNEWLCGITDPPWIKDPEFFTRWVGSIPGQVVELSCHPGHRDNTVLGRDCHPGDGLLERRIDEFRLLAQPEFIETCRSAGFTLRSVSRWLAGTRRLADAA
jgi:predicted glycoside hydrolase/deacetylase ChbG (UPF0249 family)